VRIAVHFLGKLVFAGACMRKEMQLVKKYLTPEEQGFPLLMSLKGSIATLCMNIPDE
jgi:hypothetical protein